MIRHQSTAPLIPLPLFVTGVAGVAGFNAFHFFRSKFPEQVIGERRANNWPLNGPGVVACDVEDKDSLKRLFDTYQFRSVLNCAGSCKLKSCELDPAMAWRVNVDGINNLLDVIDGADVRLVHLSIDLVFSGAGSGNYCETDSTDPVTVYGKTMVAAEQLILERRPEACILRISLPMGISFNGHAGAIDWIQSRFKNGRPATLYYDEVRTPTYTDCMNRLFENVLAGEMSGLFHSGGQRQLSLYQIAQIVNRIGGYDPNLLQGCPRIDAGPVPPRAGNVTLNSSKLTETLGESPFDPWPLYDEHIPTDREWHFSRPSQEPASPEFLAEVLYNNPNYRLANVSLANVS